jgi:DNA-binding transcriptional ArsR family regulator
MARLLPIQSETEVPDAGPRVVDLEGEDADAVFSALSSDTARNIYRALQEEPHTPSEIAEAADTSIQNVRYHLDNLEDAGLIEVVDTWYSSRGNEMSVYAPTSDALVLASGEEQTSRLKTALSRLVSGIVVLALASLAFQRAAKSFVGGKIGLGGGSPQGDGAAEDPGSYEFATDGGDGDDGGSAGGVGGDGGTGGDAAGGPAGTDQAKATEAVEDATTQAGDVDIMNAETSTPTPGRTATTGEEATRTATVETTQGDPATVTHSFQETGTPTASVEPDAGKTVVESAANTTLDQAVRSGNATVEGTVRETTTAMTSDPSTTTTVTDAARAGNDAVQAGGLEPGLVFFAGGAVVLLAVVGYLYWRGA